MEKSNRAKETKWIEHHLKSLKWKLSKCLKKSHFSYNITSAGPLLRKVTPKLPTFPDFETEKKPTKRSIKYKWYKKQNQTWAAALRQIFHNISFTVYILFLHPLQKPSCDQQCSHRIILEKSFKISEWGFQLSSSPVTDESFLLVMHFPAKSVKPISLHHHRDKRLSGHMRPSSQDDSLR